MGPGRRRSREVLRAALTRTGAFSSWLLEGRSYDLLAIAHMATVVLTLVFILAIAPGQQRLLDPGQLSG